MSKPRAPEGKSADVPKHRSRWIWLMPGAVLVMALLIWFWPPQPPGPGLERSSAGAGSLKTPRDPYHDKQGRYERRPIDRSQAQEKSAAEIVAGKVAQFAQSRRQLALALARRHQVEMSEEVERFFAAVESGNWEEIEARLKAINGGDSSAGQAPGRSLAAQKLWPAIIDAYGAAEQAHLWPAQNLLDYGNAILDSLRPGMIYVGGTDNGRWVPELLNETSDGERHIVLTQNGLADASYLDFLRLQYGDRLAIPSEEDSQRAFQDYVADAQKRLEHDQQFPDEPKQVLPSEDIRISGGHTEVSGQAAVMNINERLLTMLMQINPGQSFALQESFPFKSTYAQALPLGPIMELNAQDTETGFTAETASKTVNYWSAVSQQILGDSTASGSTAVLNSYSHDTVAAGNLLAAGGFNAEAEQAYRLASQLAPDNPEAVSGLAQLLARTGRSDEAQQLVDNFARNYPAQRAVVDNWSVTLATRPQASSNPGH